MVAAERAGEMLGVDSATVHLPLVRSWLAGRDAEDKYDCCLVAALRVCALPRNTMTTDVAQVLAISVIDDSGAVLCVCRPEPECGYPQAERLLRTRDVTYR